MANAEQSQSQIRIPDGSLDFTGGVDSFRPSTIASANLPGGLPRNCVAWLNNASVRGGGISQRYGWKRVAIVADGTLLYQGGFMYDQGNGYPYLVLWLSGHAFRIRLDTDNSTDIISGSATMPADASMFHFAQGEEFLVTQAGDYTTLPVFWDGTTMRRSVGLAPTDGSTPELPAAGPMVYYQGRFFYAIGRIYTGGDILRGSAGTTPYNKRDSILKVTENPLSIGGDGFSVPTTSGNIRALQYVANIDSTLGEGTLYVFTRKQVYAIDIPIRRADWIATDTNDAPVQRIVQRNNGSVNDRSVVAMNGDLFYQSLEPSIRSLMVGVRQFGQWGNVPISRNIWRALAFNNRGLMSYSSGIEFDNRLWQTILPTAQAQGVTHPAIAVLDFAPVSTLGDQTPPVWEGIYTGLDILQLFTGDFGGLERAFAVSVSRDNQQIEVWELTTTERFEGEDNRVQWYVETPHYTWGREFDLKQLDGGEIWVDKLYGTVDITVSYRVDANPCWQYWHQERICVARNSQEDVNNPVTYPTQLYREGGKFPIVLPVPPSPPCDGINSRPMTLGHQFQLKIEISGWCRIRGIIVYAIPRVKGPFEGLRYLPSALPEAF